MINDIVKAIAIKLNEIFGDEYKIYTEEVKQGFKEPCFFIALIKPSANQLLGARSERKQLFDIHFFPKEDNSKNSQINDVLDKLYQGMKFITTIDGDILHGTKLNGETVDGVLHFFVNYNFTIREIVEEPYMEELKIITDVKGEEHGEERYRNFRS